MLVLIEDEAQRLKMGLLMFFAFSIFCLTQKDWCIDCNYDKPSMYLGMFKALWCVN